MNILVVCTPERWVTYNPPSPRVEYFRATDDVLWSHISPHSPLACVYGTEFDIIIYDHAVWDQCPHCDALQGLLTERRRFLNAIAVNRID